jgi:hypothetical protein
MTAEGGSTMATEFKTVDIGDAPDLVRLAEEVRATRETRILRRHEEDLAMLAPVPATARRRRSRAKISADFEAFRSSAGSWQDVDTDQLIADIFASRERSTRPSVEL